MWLAAGNYMLKASGLVKQPASRQPQEISFAPQEVTHKLLSNHITTTLQGKKNKKNKQKNPKWTYPKGETPLQPNGKMSIYSLSGQQHLPSEWHSTIRH